MRYYRVFIHGRNFLVNFEGQMQKLGFFTTRFVMAEDPDQAELFALQLVRDRQSLRDVVQNCPDDPPAMFVEEIVELATLDEIKSLEPGLAWYSPTADDE